jgi:transposase
MLRTTLSDTARDELQRLRRQPRLAALARDRAEMVLLSAAGWSPPRIARHLRYCPQTVRSVLQDYRDRGTAALSPRRTGPAPDAARRQQVTELLRELLAQGRTWTAPQLAAALADRDVRLGARQVRRYLHLLGAGYHRTVATLDHKQDPAKVARARGVLDGLEKKRPRAV